MAAFLVMGFYARVSLLTSDIDPVIDPHAKGGFGGRLSNSSARYAAREIKSVETKSRLADCKSSAFARVAQCD